MRIIKICIAAGFLGFLLYQSVYFESLKQKNNALKQNEFNPVAYAQHLFQKNKTELFTNAIPYNVLMKDLQKNKQDNFKKYGHNEGISSSWYFLVKSTGIIDSTVDGYATVSLSKNHGMRVHLTNSGIFGNAIIDATQLASVDDFPSIMDFNNISNEINKIVEKNTIPLLKSKSNIGKKITFVGALQLQDDEAVPTRKTLEMTPVAIHFVQ